LQITTLTDRNLLSGIKAFVSKERKITSIIISHLEEIERRKLYSDLKYSSLFRYCTGELGYSEDQACRRINAMRVSRKLPQVKEKIDSGKITSTTLNLFSAASNELKLKPKEQNKLLQVLEKKSKRECQIEIDKIRASKGKEKPPKRAYTKIDTGKKTRVSLSLDHQVIDDLRSMASEKKMALEDYVSFLVSKEKSSAPAPTAIKSQKGKEVGKGRYIPKRVKEFVRARANNQCEKCGSTHQLQFEHQKPVAHGGESRKENLKLYCRNCNLRAGVKVFGVHVMKRG